jgi:hypothetical protein
MIMLVAAVAAVYSIAPYVLLMLKSGQFLSGSQTETPDSLPSWL